MAAFPAAQGWPPRSGRGAWLLVLVPQVQVSQEDQRREQSLLRRGQDRLWGHGGSLIREVGMREGQSSPISLAWRRVPRSAPPSLPPKPRARIAVSLVPPSSSQTPLQGLALGHCPLTLHLLTRPAATCSRPAQLSPLDRHALAGKGAGRLRPHPWSCPALELRPQQQRPPLLAGEAEGLALLRLSMASEHWRLLGPRHPLLATFPESPRC